MKENPTSKNTIFLTITRVSFFAWKRYQIWRKAFQMVRLWPEYIDYMFHTNLLKNVYYCGTNQQNHINKICFILYYCSLTICDHHQDVRDFVY
jgi:hypothetical protein